MAFRLPTHVTIRPGCLGDLERLARELAPTRALLVTDAGLDATPWPERAAAALGPHERFSAVECNPRRRTIDALAADARKSGVDLVVGLGGGSVLDAAKAVAMLLTNPGSCADYEGKNLFPHRPATFVAIPTTCGTGSEVTWVSVISHEDEARKISVKGDGMFPDHALVDAELLTSLPRPLVAATGMDALTHALEAYTGRAANPISDALAESAVTLLLTYLERAWRDPAGDDEAREAVMRGSTIAGIAFGNADVGAVHCLSESMGGLYDVPHGLANATLLVPVMRYHLEAARERLARLGRVALGEQDADALLERIEALRVATAIPGFGHFEIPAKDHPRLAELAAANNSNGSNPQPMAAADYRRILERASEE